MKMFSLVVLGLVLAPAAHAETKCDLGAAKAKALKVSKALIDIEGFQVAPGVQEWVLTETEGQFIIKNFYDTGLHVPTYTVTVSKYNCLVTQVVFTDEEG